MEDCAAVSADLLDVAAPSELRREDLARALRWRGAEPPWKAVENVFLAAQAK